MIESELDGRIGEGWGGVKPNGSHVNVVLAARGSPTFAAAIGMFTHPSPGHTPVLVCVGPDEASYEPIWPPTLMMNKATASTPPWWPSRTAVSLPVSASQSLTVASQLPVATSLSSAAMRGTP